MVLTSEAEQNEVAISRMLPSACGQPALQAQASWLLKAGPRPCQQVSVMDLQF